MAVGMAREKATRFPAVMAMNPRETPASDKISVKCSLAWDLSGPRVARHCPFRMWMRVSAPGGGRNPSQTAAIGNKARQMIGISHIGLADPIPSMAGSQFRLRRNWRMGWIAD